MGFFGERGVDVLDLTLLKKKGILKIKDAPREAEVIDLTKVDRDGFAPLANPVSSPFGSNSNISSNSLAGQSLPTASTSSSTGGTTFTSFWDAPVSTTPANMDNFETPASVSSSSSSDIDVRNFGVKIEDVEYKMERLSEKLIALESKIDEIARNIR